MDLRRFGRDRVSRLKATFERGIGSANGSAWARVALCAAGLGLALRIYVALKTVGSNDAVIWSGFADQIARNGLHATYRDDTWFNHPPLMGYMATAIRWLDRRLPLSFATLFKLPSIAAEGLILYLLWRIWRERGSRYGAAAVAFYALNPVTTLVSAYHGNTDLMVSAFALLAAVLVHEKRSPLLVGLALAAAINVKLIPVLLIPVLGVFYLPSLGRVARYVAGLAIGALPFALVLPVWDAFNRNAIAYNSMFGVWGFNQLLLRTAGTLPEIHRFIERQLLPAGRDLILLSVLLLAAWQAKRRRFNAFEASALCFCAFLILAPGFGIQYTSYPAPALFAVSLAWGSRYAWIGGAFVGICYYGLWTRSWPAFSNFNAYYPMPSELFGFLAWTTLMAFTWHVLRNPAGNGERGRLDRA